MTDTTKMISTTETAETPASKKGAAKKAPPAAETRKAVSVKEEAESPNGISYDFAKTTETESPTVPLNSIVMPDFDSRASEAEPDQPFLDDIRERGIISPLAVAALEDGRWLLVAGRRRFKAAKALGLKTVPIAPRTLQAAGELSAKEQAMLLCLSENLNRQDLNAWDMAVQFRHFKEMGWSQTKIAKSLGRKDAFVSQYLGMFELDKRTQTVIRTNANDSGVISKARLLKQIKDPDMQVQIAKDCFDKTNPWTVTQLNDVVQDIQAKEEARAKKEAEREAAKAKGDKKPRKAAASDDDSEEAEEEEAEVEESEFEKASMALKLTETRAFADLIKSRFEKTRSKYAEAESPEAKAKAELKLQYERGCYDTMKQIFGLKAAPKNILSE